MKNNKKFKSTSQTGFTLIELMITVAILGIISAIALPSYTEHVRKGKRSDAKVELLRLAQMQESYFVQNLSYAKDLDQLGFGAITIDSEKGLYNISSTAAKADDTACTGLVGAGACTQYTFTADRDSAESQAGDTQCKSFRIDNVGRQLAYGGSDSSHGNSASHIASARLCW